MTRTSKGSGLVPKAGGDSVPDDAASIIDRMMIDYTQPEYADRLVSAYGERFRHITSEKLDLYFSDGRWREDEYDAMFHFCETMCREILSEVPLGDDGKPGPHLATARKRTDTRQIESICRIARTRRPIVSTRRRYDANPDLLNMPNGTYDFFDATIHDHDPKDMITKITAASYDPDAIGPTFDRYFAEVQPDPEAREQILRNLGYSLHGKYGEYIFVHTGSGGNGKSTLLKLVERIAGDYAKQISWKVLTNKADDSHETILAELEGVRLGIVQMGSRSLSPEQLRDIVAEPSFKARRMHRDSRTVDASHSLHTAQNDALPSKIDASTRRRIIVHSWDVEITEPDEMLPSRLWLERDYVLTLIIDAYHRWSESEMSRSDTEDYYRKLPIYAWAYSDEVARGPELSWPARELYEAYKQSDYFAGESETRFGTILGNIDFPKERNRKGNLRRGIGLIKSESR
jgi:putative DNA primase/helicase